MQIDYVDIFYHHRADPNTPLEESMRTLDLMVRQGKALYVGISSYDAAETKKAVAILNDLGTSCLIHQPKYSMLDRWVEDGLLDVLDEEGVGCITFSSLAQGLLTNRYINGIPKDSRAASGRGNGAIESGQIQPNEIALANALNEMAQQRGQSLAQMALAWVLKDKRITSVLLGVSRKEQLLDSLKALEAGPFSQEELTQIDQLLQTHS
jgi:L-glyceraldehyde 3-phosphate reductase